MKNNVEAVYVLYVISSGIIDDIKEVIKTLNEPEWKNLPIQL